MISICIPVYNYDIGELLGELRAQVNNIPQAVEIIVVDDASDASIREVNQRKEHLADQFICLPKNIGRSAIRNFLVEHARYEYQLFLDCDVLPLSKEFIVKYIHQLNSQPAVVYGGRVFPEHSPGKQQQLRWAYGKYIESKSATERKIDPYRNFHSNNFLIRKSIFETIQFDETFTGYGYEDSLFALRLKKSGITITHIDNPVMNVHIESNKTFLDQIDESMQNLVRMQSQVDMSPVVSLIPNAHRYQWIVRLLPVRFNRVLREQLANGSGNLQLLQLYKLLTWRRTARQRR